MKNQTRTELQFGASDRAHTTTGEYPVRRTAQMNYVFQTGDQPHVLPDYLTTSSTPLIIWRKRGLSLTRMLLGGISILAAWYNWQVLGGSHVAEHFSQAQAATSLLASWFHFWLHACALQPDSALLFIAMLECGIGLCLLAGLLTNLACGAGLLLTLTGYIGLIPGKQGPDMGVLLVALLAFGGLILSKAGQMYGLDQYIASHLGRWSFLASREEKKPQTFYNTVTSLTEKKNYHIKPGKIIEMPREAQKKQSERVLFL